jgi:hypothetical protein
MDTRLSRQAADQKMVDGVSQYMSQLASIHVAGHSMTPAEMVQLLQSRLDAAKAVIEAEAALRAAIQAERDLRVKTATTVSSLRQLVGGMFSQAPDMLAVFGLKPRKGSSLSAEARAQAVLKGRATRKARHTMGKKQKLAIKGALPETSPTAPATPAEPTA